MNQRQDIALAVTVLRDASLSPELQASIGLECAATLEKAADRILALVADDRSSMSEVSVWVCDLACSCVGLVGKEPLEQDDGDCGPILWGFGAPVAEAVGAGLAAMANLLPDVTFGPQVQYVLGDLGFDLDCLSVYMYGTLCRLDVAGSSGGGPSDSDQECRLENALRGICTWTLAALARTVDHNQFGGLTLWEWAFGDAFWSLVLAKGVLSFKPTIASTTVLIPTDLPTLKTLVILATLSLADSSVAFARESTCGNNIPILRRGVALARHRARIAQATLDCDFMDVLLEEALTAPVDWIPQLACFLAALLRPVLPGGDDPVVWDAAGPEFEPEDNIGGIPSISLAQVKNTAVILAAHLRSRSDMIWYLLTTPGFASFGGASGGRSFLLDCATIAHALPPAVQAYESFISSTVSVPGQTTLVADERALSTLCVLSSNAGIEPGPFCMLSGILDSLPTGDRAKIVRRLTLWRGPVQPAALSHWISILGGESDAQTEEATADAGTSVVDTGPLVDGSADPALPSGLAVTTRTAPEAMAKARVDLRSLVCNAPQELRCALDGKLLADPVRSPHGHIFERSILVRRLLETPGVCPITCLPLALEDCHRAADIRAQVTRWVRSSRPAPKNSRVL